ncbi:DUF1836 domain-containing protein [Floccifex sp.]|uniref:DUF1836 domain-containing protein n=1 Tax=Floccifex sp. TaxID=2815810 RepID=UPI002A74A1A0|nr:DUF1836 domain-containing protein [Floccifex sp.]MDD7282162.1 DUF1836 domain-containing protein [Erysipelotrichaceae bacterium]MDY2959055.1 DUF1836 domain-containing protein [Floccifex sp.]
MNQKIQDEIRNFYFPSYQEIPDVGLYLEQTTDYINAILFPLTNEKITKSMISNYVKKGLISSPIKKKYNRDQIAILIYLALAKTIVSLEDIQLLLELKDLSYDNQTAFDYFKVEFENVLHYVFGIKDSLDSVGKDDTYPKSLLRSTIIAFAHKIYLNKSFKLLHEQMESSSKL